MVSKRPSPATKTGFAKHAAMSRCADAARAGESPLPLASRAKPRASAARGNAKVGTEQPSIPISSRSNSTPQISEMICPDLLLHPMVGPLIAAWIEPAMECRGEHAGMLAGAIIVDGLGAAARARQLPRRPLADRPMRPASELTLVEPSLGEQRAHRGDVNRVAAMRGAGDGELGLTETERVGGAALDQRNGLQGLDGGARKYRTRHIAERQQEMSISVGDGDGAAMAALDQAPARHLDEDRIVVRGFDHAAAMTTGARRAPHRPGAGSKMPGTGLTARGATTMCIEAPGCDGVPVAANQPRPAALAIGALASLVVNIAGIDVTQARLQRDLPRPPQRGRRRGCDIPHFPVGVERGEMERHIWPEPACYPFAKSRDLLVRVVLARE